MPQLGLSVSDSFKARINAHPYGRRIRHVEGLRVAGERSFYPKAALTLMIATATTSFAAWSLFAFPH